MLKEQVTALERARQALVPLNTALSEPLALLLTVPGSGFGTAVSVLAETQGFHGLQSSRQLSTCVGIAPAQHQSGGMTGSAHISETGNEHFRRAADLATVGAMKCKGPVGHYRRQIRAREKPPTVALGSEVARIWMCSRHFRGAVRRSLQKQAKDCFAGSTGYLLIRSLTPCLSDPL
ncbi:transposase [Deinococcus sp. QL22]|uniref:transposase n=1 Tax=Deinococcus sp. QL22 TaxID=2939437 RepID=UPI00352FEF8C